MEIGGASDSEMVLAKAKVRDAEYAARKIRRAVFFSRTSAVTLILFGGLSSLICVFDPVSAGMAVSLVVLICGIFEWRLGSQLRAGRSEAPRRLAINQLVLAAAIIAYAAWQIHAIDVVAIRRAFQNPEVAKNLALLDPSIASLLEKEIPRIIRIFYGLVAGVAGLGCGVTALYYRRRRRFLGFSTRSGG